jgi:hypothetical protein
VVKITEDKVISLTVTIILLLCSISSAYSIPLDHGWNLVSSPIDNDSPEISSLLRPIEGSYEMVISYNNTRNEYHIYDPDDTGHSNLFSLNPGTGFWILMNKSAELNFNDSPDSFTIPLTKGWNLIGLGDLDNMSMEEMFSSINDSLEMAFHYNNNWSPFIRGANHSEDVKKGKGYWVKVKEDTALAIYNPAPQIDSITISPDESTDAGVQVNPIAGSVMEVVVSAEVTNWWGAIGIREVTMLTPKGEFDMERVEVIDRDTAIYNGSFEMEYYDAAGTYNATVTAVNYRGLSDTETAEFEYLELAALDFDSSVIDFGTTSIGITKYVMGDSEMSTQGIPTIKNVGNVKIDILVNATDLSSENDRISVEHTGYQIGTGGFHVSTPIPLQHDINLSPSSVINLDLNLTVPMATLPESYSGIISVNSESDS